jgi:hypothetical protein
VDLELFFSKWLIRYEQDRLVSILPWIAKSLYVQRATDPSISKKKGDYIVSQEPALPGEKVHLPQEAVT